MKIAVINETSAAHRNADIIAALEGRGHEVFNVGMTERGAQPELSYIHTGLMTAILLNLKLVDFVVGGCGTGQGYLNSALQYPGVFCGHVMNDLDAWMFARINAGNCISLALNQGYGWASEVNLRFIFDRLFSGEFGVGYPVEREAPQKDYRTKLMDVSDATHRSLPDIIDALPDDFLLPAIEYPAMKPLLQMNLSAYPMVQAALQRRILNGGVALPK